MSKEKLFTETEQDNYTAQELFIEEELHCCLCGHELEFQHEIDFLNHALTEKAQCPGCHVKTQARAYTLH